jgi:hypothetical protein
MQCFVRWHSAGNVKPGKDLMPDLPKEGAFGEEVAQRFWLLVTAEALGVVLQPSSRQSVCRPATV